MNAVLTALLWGWLLLFVLMGSHCSPVPRFGLFAFLIRYAASFYCSRFLRVFHAWFFLNFSHSLTHSLFYSTLMQVIPLDISVIFVGEGATPPMDNRTAREKR